MANSKKPASSDLPQYLGQRLVALSAPGRRVTLALSGGVDSVVLLHLLQTLSSKLEFSLSAIHINHQLSPHAAEWAKFCTDLCAQYKIPLQVQKVQVARRSKLGLEAAARAARYQAFAELDCDVLLLAHHLDDQVETLLHNLLRGAGLAGASGMPEVRQQALHNSETSLLLARPLIAVPRATLLAYAEQHHLRWVEDESNTDSAFTRNFLRHEILPLIEGRFPAYRENLARAAQHFAEADQLLRELAVLDLGQVMRAEKLHLAALTALSPARAMNVLRAYLEQQAVPAMDTARIQEWLRQLLCARGDRQVALGVAGLKLRRYRGEAWVELDKPALDPGWYVAWQGERKLRLEELGVSLSLFPAQGIGISLAKLTRAAVTIRLRQGGEKLQPSCGRPRRTLKHLLQEAGIPSWQRERLPLIYSGEQLVAVPGIGVDCAFQAIATESALQMQWSDFSASQL